MRKLVRIFVRSVIMATGKMKGVQKFSPVRRNIVHEKYGKQQNARAQSLIFAEQQSNKPNDHSFS